MMIMMLRHKIINLRKIFYKFIQFSFKIRNRYFLVKVRIKYYIK